MRCLYGCLICIVVLGLAGCIPTSPTRADIIGLWVERRESSRVKDEGPCAYFEFSETGMFKAHQIPREYFILDRSLPLTRLTRIDATGSWVMDPIPADPFALTKLQLTFDSAPGYPEGFTSQLSITYPPERVLLAGVADNPWLTFYKRSEQKCQ